MRRDTDIVWFLHRSSSSLQSGWNPIQDSVSNVSLSASTCSDHLHPLPSDDVVLAWIHVGHDFRVIGERVGNPGV